MNSIFRPNGKINAILSLLPPMPNSVVDKALKLHLPGSFISACKAHIPPILIFSCLAGVANG